MNVFVPIKEFCLLCLVVLILIYGTLLQYCCQYLSFYLLFMKHNLFMWNANKMLLSFNFVVRLNFEKKTHASSICKQFLFPKSNDPPKVATPKGC